MRPLVILLIMLLGLATARGATGPFFGNGFRNGAADQSSVVVWTRLTTSPDGNSHGVPFLVPSKEAFQQLISDPDEAKIMAAQIPAKLSLADMQGACPGSAGEVQLTYFPRTQPELATTLDWVAVDAERNFTRQWQLNTLKPGTEYRVQLSARANASSAISARIEGSFHTPPTKTAAANLGFCVVTCHDYMRRDAPDGHRIYPAMQRLQPDFYVHTGDIEYYDRPSPYALTEQLMRFKWDRLLALPLQRDFWRTTTTYFMKDDHDVLTNDASPGMSYGRVGWARGLALFDEQNPTAGLPYRTVRWGRDLQIWMLEGRNYRSRNDEPDGPSKTILGAEQKAWLFRTLQESNATFKLVITSSPIVGPDREKKHDNYSNSNFRREGDEIRDFVGKLKHVIILTGDRHWQYVSHPAGTNLWEFSVGAGSDEHAGGWKQDEVRPEHRFLRVKGGFLSGQVAHNGPEVTLVLHHRDVDGTIVHTETFPQ